MSKYYLKNRDKWRRGGCYYYYKPKINSGHLQVKRGTFLIEFN
tara:strand:+ start:729 stop:857 length:129 start_codon:yes stop_codon:yes gene_type:complete